MDLNPLTGQPLAPYEVLVIGSPMTGNRVTVVDTRPGALVPSWITVAVDDGDTRHYFDNGLRGGSYLDDGAYQLPDLNTNAPAPWLAIAAILGVLFVFLRGGKGGRSWA